jgi:hypothetical protein
MGGGRGRRANEGRGPPRKRPGGPPRRAGLDRAPRGGRAVRAEPLHPGPGRPGRAPGYAPDRQDLAHHPRRRRRLAQGRPPSARSDAAATSPGCPAELVSAGAGARPGVAPPEASAPRSARRPCLCRWSLPRDCRGSAVGRTPRAGARGCRGREVQRGGAPPPSRRRPPSSAQPRPPHGAPQGDGGSIAPAPRPAVRRRLGHPAVSSLSRRRSPYSATIRSSAASCACW